MDIELINEQVKLFYSALDEVTISTDNDSFYITEYVQLGLGKHTKYYPLEKVVINFEANGKYNIESELIFDPPQYNKEDLLQILNTNRTLLQNIKDSIPLTD